MKFDNIYKSLYLDYCYLLCYSHSVSAIMSFGLHQVFHVELGSRYRTLNRTLYKCIALDFSNSVNIYGYKY